MREKAPIKGSKIKKPDFSRWGSPQWERKLSDPDAQRRVLTDNGTVQADGLRHVEWVKTGSPQDEAMIVGMYRKLGYEIKDEGWRLELTIPDTIYQERKTAQEAKALANEKRHGRRSVNDGGLSVTDEYIEETPVSSADLLGGI